MDADLLEQIIDQRLIVSAYQPLVDLYSGDVLGYEALARGPEGPLARPDQLFAAAREHGRLFEVDRACRAAGVRGAQAAGLRAPTTLFLNIEPEAVDMSGGGATSELARIPGDMRLVIEVTERALTSRPADLLPLVEQLRRHGIGIALDDVGVDRRSLALMPFLRPDVIKLDLSLTQNRPSEEIAEVHNAVSAHAERTGAVIVAEGIENEHHLERARAMGAYIGQGWLFGRPGPLPSNLPDSRSSIPVFEPAMDDAETPFRSIEGRRDLRRGTKRLLLEISRELERQASRLGDSAVLISTFQHARHFTASQAALYGDLSRSLAFVGVLAEQIPATPAAGVRGCNLTAEDPLVAEWDIVVVSPHFAAAFTAIDLGDSGPDMERRFDFQLTHDRGLALGAARTLMSRIEPLETTISVDRRLAAVA
ncbi:MAG: sensor domain-containing phosphodiesterase [Thermoleophilaceae bacterium]